MNVKRPDKSELLIVIPCNNQANFVGKVDTFRAIIAHSCKCGRQVLKLSMRKVLEARQRGLWERDWNCDWLNQTATVSASAP